MAVPETLYCRFTGEALTVIRWSGAAAVLSDGTPRAIGELTRVRRPPQILEADGEYLVYGVTIGGDPIMCPSLGMAYEVATR
jgi:hypothetical protein